MLAGWEVHYYVIISYLQNEEWALISFEKKILSYV